MSVCDINKLNTVEDCFEIAQDHSSLHKKLVLRLNELRKETTSENFSNSFLNCLKIIFSRKEKAPCIEKSVNFAVKFCIFENCDWNAAHQRKENIPENADDEEIEEISPFLMKIIQFISIVHSSEFTHVRLRSCQFIAKLLDEMEDQMLDDEVYKIISDSMMKRLKDKVPVVRTQAVNALVRLQDPMDPECSVIKAYLFHLQKDPSADVRKATLINIARTTKTVSAILGRTLDCKPAVQREAFRVLTKLHIKSLTIKQRETVLFTGLHCRDDVVVDIVKKQLLPGWLENVGGNFLEFLRALDVEHSTEICLEALNILFKSKDASELSSFVKLDQSKLLPVEELTAESVFLWKSVAHFLHKLENEELLSSTLPTLSTFSEYIKSYLTTQLKYNLNELEAWEMLLREFIMLQLLEIAEVYDFSDEAGRINFKKLLTEMLLDKNVRANMVPLIVKHFKNVISEPRQRVQDLSEVISEISEPMVLPETCTDTENKEAEMVNDEDEGNENDPHPPDMVQSYPSSVIDVTILTKCMTILYEMMKASDIKILYPELRSFMENFVSKYSQPTNLGLKLAVMKAMCMFCLLDKDVAQERILFFYFHLANGHESLSVCTAVECIFDIFLKYGIIDHVNNSKEDAGKRGCDKRKKLYDEAESQEITVLEDSPDGSSNSTDLLEILYGILESATGEMIVSSATGFCKLMLSGRLRDPDILSQLTLLWFKSGDASDTPNSVSEPVLAEIIGHFFDLYVSKQVNYQVIVDSYIPTIRHLMEAPIASPLMDIDMDSVFRLLSNLTKPTDPNQVNYHNAIIVILLKFIVKNADIPCVSTIIKSFGYLELTLNFTEAEKVMSLARKVSDLVGDKVASRHLSKFMDTLKSTIGERKPSDSEKSWKDDAASTEKEEGEIQDTSSDVCAESKRNPDSLSEKSLESMVESMNIGKKISLPAPQMEAPSSVSTIASSDATEKDSETDLMLLSSSSSSLTVASDSSEIQVLDTVDEVPTDKPSKTQGKRTRSSAKKQPNVPEEVNSSRMTRRKILLEIESNTRTTRSARKNNAQASSEIPPKRTRTR